MMLERLAILGLALALAPVVSGQPNQAPNSRQQPAKQSKPAVIPANGPNGQANVQTNQADPPKWYKALERPDWWLVIIAGLTGCVISWQSWEMRKAAEAGLESTKAALLNAQALINSERPWILITTKPRVHGLPGFDVFAENKGRTPAAIVAKYWNAVIVENVEQLPVKPEWESCKNYPDPVILVPDESFLVHTIAKPTIAFAGKSVEILRQVEEGSLEAYVFGCVAYRDLLSRLDSPSHETGWRYLCVPDGEAVILATDFDRGEYTKHT